MNLTRYLILGGALVVLAGCDPWATSPSTDCFFVCGTSSSPSVTFKISPDSAHMLIGDTATFYTWQCGSGEWFCGFSGNVSSNWSISGNSAVAVRAGGATTDTVLAAMTIVVRATAIGNSDIRALSTINSTTTDTVRVHVADSSAITSIERSAFAPPIETLRQKTASALYVVLKDAAGNQYLSMPTDWSVSDTTILQLVGSPRRLLSGPEISQQIVAKNVGSADVTVKFLDVSTTVRLTVIP